MSGNRYASVARSGLELGNENFKLLYIQHRHSTH